MALVQWKSGKTPRQCLGSNGADVQAITMGEEFAGTKIQRDKLHDALKVVAGAVVMDSRGIYDAMTRNLSSVHGLRDSRAGYELTLAVNQALRWVNGLAQLGDSLTKFGARKTILQFFSQKQFWRLVHDDKFEAGRKVHKRALEKKWREMQANFVDTLRGLAAKHNWPWDFGEPVPVCHPLYDQKGQEGVPM